MVEALKVAGVKVKKCDCHAIYRLANKKIVIAKLHNRNGFHKLTQKQKQKNMRTQSETIKIKPNQ